SYMRLLFGPRTYGASSNFAGAPGVNAAPGAMGTLISAPIQQPRVMKKQVTEWRRRHAIEPTVTLRVITSPLDGWIVSIDGWTAPSHFSRAHPDIESAQRAPAGL